MKSSPTVCTVQVPAYLAQVGGHFTDRSTWQGEAQQSHLLQYAVCRRSHVSFQRNARTVRLLLVTFKQGAWKYQIST
jgi:hypothetical protein